MLSMRWNRFPVCSACDEISSPYAKCAIKFVPRMLSMDCTCKNAHILPLADHARKFVPRMLSMRWNRFRACSACDKIVSANAQHTHAIIFENDSKISIKMQISPIKNPILKNRLGTYLIGPKWRFWRKKILDISQKNLVLRMLSHRGNVRTSKFWRKSKEKKRNFFRKFTKGM